MSLAVREGQWPPRRALCRARPRGGPASSPHPRDVHYPTAIRAPAHTPELCDTLQHQSQLRVRNNQPARAGHSCFLFLSSELAPLWEFTSPEGEHQMSMWFYIPVQAAVPVIVKNAEASSWISWQTSWLSDSHSEWVWSQASLLEGSHEDMLEDLGFYKVRVSETPSFRVQWWVNILFLL